MKCIGDIKHQWPAVVQRQRMIVPSTPCRGRAAARKSPTRFGSGPHTAGTGLRNCAHEVVVGYADAPSAIPSIRDVYWIRAEVIGRGHAAGATRSTPVSSSST